MKRRKMTLMAGVFALALVAGGVARARTGLVQDTKGTYLQKCAVCHAPDGSGNTAYGKKNGLRDLRSKEVQSLSDDKLLAIISKGGGKMPGYEKSLGSDVCRKLVGYTRELAKK
ncbi:MAG: cytochrome c [Acidobacteria bacterium]|nr:cytochrome c [Acidobacteriota bacterium]